MASPVLGNLTAAVSKITTVIPSAVALLNGVAERIKIAVDAALANGATAAELEPVTAEIALINSNADTLAAAVAAHTVAEPKP